ncbi:MAG: XcyI family restriction endonuclease [Bryobacteraceae bacterium]
MKKTVDDPSFDLEALNSELSEYADSKHLKRLASFGLRGEVCFPVPYLFRRNAYLLGYYRLLYGFSCKAFYDQGPFKRFQRLENDGIVRHDLEALIPAFCRSLARTGEMLLEAVNSVSLSVVNDLQVLTLGAQLRGSGNVKLGQNATDSFFGLMKVLLAAYNPKVKGHAIGFQNDSKLPVSVRFGSDPDVSITLKLEAEERKLVAIELKGGMDVSNIWNRLGEAEKSHAKAKASGFNELWTVTRIDLNSDPELHKKARRQSASTTRFFFLDRIADPTTPEAISFRQVLGSIMGVNLAP